jgi:folate-binding protein YgfZ
MTSNDPTAAVRAVTGSTRIRLEGNDALPLLHRISTQSLVDLTPGHARATLFCDFRGRLLHRAIVAVTSDRAVWLLRDDAPAADLAAFIDRHVFREDVRMTVADGAWRVRPVVDSTLAPGTLEEHAAGRMSARADDDFARIVEPGEPVVDDAFEPARVRAGRPRHGHEITEDFNPFEVGLAREVHLSKGCFTGQEALMRLITYQSVRRRLVRVAGRGEPPSPPCSAVSEGKEVGVLTSAVADGPGWLGLAVIRHAALTTPALSIEERAIEVVEIFPETRPLGLPE